MAEDDTLDNEATGASEEGGGNIDEGDAARPTSGGPAGEGDDASQRPGDWNPGEQSGSGGELY